MTRSKQDSSVAEEPTFDDYICNFTTIQEYTYVTVLYIGNKIVTLLYYTYVTSKLYVLWILLHYFASHLYVYYCVPKTVVGFIMSPFLIASPQCHSLDGLYITVRI